MDDSSRTVWRVLAVLEQLSVEPQPQTNQALARSLGVPVASMHRLLRKLVALRLVECDTGTACYSATPQLRELGNRLAEAGGHSRCLQTLMHKLRESTGDTISLWVPSGAHVRIAAVVIGRVRGPSCHTPGETQEPFTTPGLAIATQYSQAQLRTLIAQARRRRVLLGRQFRRSHDVFKAVEEVAKRGYATGFNMKSDGWGMLAWPLILARSPPRVGAVAIGALVPDLRRRQGKLLTLVERLRLDYLRELDHLERDAVRHIVARNGRRGSRET